MKTEKKYIPKKGDIFNVRERFNPLTDAATGATGLCGPYKCTGRHFIGKSLVSIDARGWSTERGGTPWHFKVSEWDFEEDGQ